LIFAMAGRAFLENSAFRAARDDRIRAIALPTRWRKPRR
jgi:hypothetical protein